MKLAATWGCLPLLGAAESIVLGIAVPDDVAGAVGVGCEEVYAVVFDGADSADETWGIRFSAMHQDAASRTWSWRRGRRAVLQPGCI